MKKEKFRRLPTFREYCNGGRIKENSTPNIKVEIEWWDDCIILILNELRSASESEPIIWEKLVDYCRARLLVLGREVPLYVDEIVLSYIKDLVFQHYNTNLFADNYDQTAKDTELGTRILIVAQISEEILHRVKIESGLEKEPEIQPEDPNTVVSVNLDNGSSPDDDLPFEHKVPLNNLTPNKNKVYGFKDYGDAIKEAYCHLQMDHYNNVVEKCLKDLETEQEKGTINYAKVLKRAKKEIDEKDDDKCLYKFISKLARKHMENERICIDGIDTSEITFATLKVFKAAQNLFIHNIVEDIKGRIGK